MLDTHAALAPPQPDCRASFDTKSATEYLFGPTGSQRTLEGWRLRGGGPAFIKAGSRVVYRRADLDAWLAANRRLSTSDRGQAA